MNIRQQVKSGELTPDGALGMLRAAKREGLYVSPSIVEWLERKRNPRAPDKIPGVATNPGARAKRNKKWRKQESR